MLNPLPEFPDRPQAQPMDWGAVARAFDHFVMNPENRVRFHTASRDSAFTAFLEDGRYGAHHHELTTFGPIALGKALLGQDVSELARSLRQFYDPQQRIFLNSPGQPRVEWWYLMNVNALAAQLIRAALMDAPEFVERWHASAERLIELARRVFYDFNDQGYDFISGTAWTDRHEYRQPDAIAAYSYLMLLAHSAFGDPLFLEEARAAIYRYLAFEENPWYEIPSGAMGAAAAAHLAALGDPVDVDKAVRFALDPHAALVTGAWNGQEVNGLARGWRHAKPESAYSMESLVLLPYLLPAARRVPALAARFGRYALNAAANARLFYTGCAPHESRPDLEPSVAYERLYQEHAGRSPYAAGDFAGHKSIYGGAYALWWAALIQPTGDPYLLRLDLTRTDFLTPDAHPAFLYYNPYPEEKVVRHPLPESALNARIWDVYDLTEHRITQQGAAGSAEIALPPLGARIITTLPVPTRLQREGPRLLADGLVVDWGI